MRRVSASPHTKFSVPSGFRSGMSCQGETSRPFSYRNMASCEPPAASACDWSADLITCRLHASLHEPQADERRNIAESSACRVALWRGCIMPEHLFLPGLCRCSDQLTAITTK